jgi:pyruvate dehydrogenase (quinone)
MSEKVSDFIIRRVQEWGVKRIFAFPGDGIDSILGALERAHDKPEFIQARHEELAAFMACAHAKYTGEVGVCMALPPARVPSTCSMASMMPKWITSLL